jgi:CheY-like chemotaxis protein
VILILTADAALQAQVEQTADRENIPCLALSDEETLLAALPEETPGVIFMDVSHLGVDAASLIEKLKRNQATAKIPLVAFGNSLRADLLQDAKEAGANLVLPRAAFNQQLPELIRHYGKAG